ncbi:hypothetical protein OB905_13250 [Halobacteria archaeon AArc-dxtr1]|nr:hypothetical protein [Halobacteria archaeon AArc-dxtr1]
MLEETTRGNQNLDTAHASTTSNTFRDGDDLPDDVVATVLEELFDASFEIDGGNPDALIASGHAAFGEEIVDDSIARIDPDGGDA